MAGNGNIVDVPKFARGETEKPIKSQILKVLTNTEKEKGRSGSSTNAATPSSKIVPVKYQNMTHRRFTGESNDFQIIVMEQKSIVPKRPVKTFSCFICGFNTTCVEVIAMHHLNRVHNGTTCRSKRKRKNASSILKNPREKARKLTNNSLAVSDSSDKHETASDKDDSEEDDGKSSTVKSVGRNNKKTGR